MQFIFHFPALHISQASKFQAAEPSGNARKMNNGFNQSQHASFLPSFLHPIEPAAAPPSAFATVLLSFQLSSSTSFLPSFSTLLSSVASSFPLLSRVVNPVYGTSSSSSQERKEARPILQRKSCFLSSGTQTLFNNLYHTPNR